MSAQIWIIIVSALGQNPVYNAALQIRAASILAIFLYFVRYVRWQESNFMCFSSGFQ